MVGIKQILIVEDEPKLASLLMEYINQSGYSCHWISNGSQVESWVKANRPSIILLDILLPEKDGMEICKALRKFADVPIIMVTAGVEEIDRLPGLELGADDYICKPYSPREVVARIKAVLRRTHARHDLSQTTHGFLVDEDRYEISLEGNKLDLTPVEFRLLKFLIESPGIVMNRQRLLNIIYTDYRIVTDRTVDSHIKNIRKKINLILPDQELIRSVYGVGYSLEIPYQ